MSKNKSQNKDKKGADSGHNQDHVIEQQKRQILEQGFTIKKLQDRISRMTEENYQIVAARDSTQKTYEQKLETQRIVLENHQSTIQRLNQKLHELEIKKIELESLIRDLERQLNFSEDTRHREMDEYKKLVTSEISLLENQLKEYNHYMKERDDLYRERNDLKKNLEDQKNNKVRDLADKEREKVQATDKLKDDMLTKIRDMRTSLLSLKKQQLTTTTRIAVLQNHQLTSQLEFQSKQTEKLIFQNESLQKKVSNLQKDLEVHKDVQQELAKRSHMSKGVIKKLTTKIAEMEEELRNVKQQPGKSLEKTLEFEEEKTKREEIISMLDRSLQEKEKQLLKLQTNFELTSAQNKNLKQKVKSWQKKSLQLMTLLTKYYDDVLQGKIDLKTEGSQEVVYDIRGMKKNPVTEWTIQECKMVVNVLLNQLRPNLSKNNLGVPAINKSQILVISDEIVERKLPKISEHSFSRKEQSKGIRDMPVNISSKIVSSNLREWGRTVHANSVAHLSRKYKVDK